MIRCDGKDCGALETMPEPQADGEEIIMPMAPKDWVLVLNPMKTYCPACKFLYGNLNEE
jgi:hypothetical protein